MGACGQLLSPRALFMLTAALAVPALLSLMRIRTNDIRQPERSEAQDRGRKRLRTAGVRAVVADRRMLTFAVCVAVFHFANAAILPLMGGVMATRAGSWAVGLTAACVLVPQVCVAGLSPLLGRKSQSWGRRPLLMLCFAALAVRCVLVGSVDASFMMLGSQVLDGLSAAILGVLFLLIVADITGGGDRFNLSLGFAVGIGASLSTTVAGITLDHFGHGITFFGLAVIAVVGLILVWKLMPETRLPEATG
jgi:predicted MFS family arabinose efflux permease